MWLRSQAEDLEVPWRAAGKSPHEKTEETGVGCPWAQQQEQTLSTGRIEPQALAGSCFSPCHPGVQLVDNHAGTTSMQGKSFP